jgi:hypothetical protein
MTIPPLPALAVLGGIHAAAQLPEIVRSADFAGLLERMFGDKAPSQVEFVGEESAAPAIDPKALAAQTAALLRGFQEQFRGLLAAAGIAADTAVPLELNPAGRLRVAEPHAEQAAIEAALDEHPELTDLFRAIAGNMARLQGPPAEPFRLTVAATP